MITNKYAATCVDCHKEVPANGGFCEKRSVLNLPGDDVTRPINMTATSVDDL